MNIMGLQKLSMLDFPDTIAATVFTHGCNLLCPFCHNPTLVLPTAGQEKLNNDDVISYFKKRKSLLQGVCISGGEPLLQPDIESFIIQIKSLGLKVKLDTNGCFPNRLENLLKKNLIDYVAMDIKNSKEKYPTTVGLPSFDTTAITASAHLLASSKIPYEFRTTIIQELYSPEAMHDIGKWLGTNVDYYIQAFVRAESLINDYTGSLPALTAPTQSQLTEAKQILSNYFRFVYIRGT